MIRFNTFCKEITDGSELLFLEPNIPVQLKNFEIDGIISDSPQAITFLIRNSALNMKCIMRVLRKWVCTNSKRQSTTYKDIFSKFKNRSSEFVQIFCVYENPAFLVIVSEHSPLGNIFNYLYGGKKGSANTLTEQSVALLAMKMLVCIKQAHEEKGILFAIKPEEVFIRSTSEVVLSHLTTAKLSLKETASKSFLEVTEYLPPEALEKKAVGSAVDIWQLGVFLYECLFGVTPFQQGSDLDTKNVIQKSNVYFPPDSVKKVSEECKEFIRILLEKNPDKRIENSLQKLEDHPFISNSSKIERAPVIFDLALINQEELLEIKTKLTDTVSLT